MILHWNILEISFQCRDLQYIPVILVQATMFRQGFQARLNNKYIYIYIISCLNFNLYELIFLEENENIFACSTISQHLV